MQVYYYGEILVSLLSEVVQVTTGIYQNYVTSHRREKKITNLLGFISD